MSDNIFYGIWIPKIGWLRGNSNRALMFDSKIVARETAKRIGKSAKVYYIDQSLDDIEAALLEAERSQVFDLKSLFNFAEWTTKKDKS